MDSESKSQVKESSVFVPVEIRFASVLKPLGGFLCHDGQKNRKRTDIALAILHRVCIPPIVCICMDGSHPPTNYYFTNFERQPSDNVKEDTEEDTEDDIIPELIRFFSLEIVELNTETAKEK
jgi:hypothetical protein